MNHNYVFACIDGSNFTEAVCDYSAWIANTLDAPLKLLHTIGQTQRPAVSDLSGAIGLGASEELLNELTEVEQHRSHLLVKKGNLMLQAAKQRVEDAGVKNIELRQQKGSLSESLVDMEEQMRVLVIGIRGTRHERQQQGLGAQLETVIRAIHQPILVVNNDFTPPKKVMLAYDGGKGSKKALEIVTSSPLSKHVPCHLVHVGDKANRSERLLDEAAHQLRTAGVETTVAQLTGKVEDALVAYQLENDIDLTVMGAFSHTRVRDFILGSFTAKMLERTQRPLFLLR
ncbi:MAG TPA: universal stress protein UspA [Gammaproteobacteria bacterium]|nr:universal stress protein UspA [Gammaproteobacteria bacterium]